MKKSTKRNLKYIINLLSVLILDGVAFVLIANAFRYDSYGFINNNRRLFIWLTFGVLFAAYIAYVILYAFDKKALYRLIFSCFAFAVIFGLVFYLVTSSGFILKIKDIDALRDYIDDFGVWMPILYAVFCFLQVVILPVPGSVTVAAGVALFGPLECSIYSFVGITLGSIVAFAIGRIIGYKAATWIVGEDALKKWLEKVKGKDNIILSLMFLLPMFPDDVLCFIAGLSTMTWKYFLIMITVTRLISVFTTSYSFNFIPITTWWGITVWVAIGIAVVVTFILLLKYADEIDGYLKKKFNKKSK